MLQSTNTMRVLVADDSVLMQQKLPRGIASSHDLELVGLARDGERLYSLCKAVQEFSFGDPPEAFFNAVEGCGSRPALLSAKEGL